MCDIAETYQNNATANVCQKKSTCSTNKYCVCDFCFGHTLDLDFVFTTGLASSTISQQYLIISFFYSISVFVVQYSNLQNSAKIHKSMNSAYCGGAVIQGYKCFSKQVLTILLQSIHAWQQKKEKGATIYKKGKQTCLNSISHYSADIQNLFI